jgi:hypothetical protein
VLCFMGGEDDEDEEEDDDPDAGWVPGTITGLMWRSDDGDMEPGMVAPYQITLDDGAILSAPRDDDELVRKAPAAAASNKRAREE